MTIEKAIDVMALTRSHYENFTVLSWLLPRHLRTDVANLYAYCRTVDDIGDEAEGDRLALLAQWEEELLRCFTGTPKYPVLVRLQDTIRKHQLRAEPFLRLIEANRRDQVRHRYQNWQQLLDYCHYSANPVGELYLALLGYTDTCRIQLANATCTALQLVNFWQDISCDAACNRIYIPMEELVKTGISADDVLNGRNSAASAQLIATLCDKTAPLFQTGLELLNLLKRREAYNVSLFSLGGMAILDAVRANRDRIFSYRPTLSKSHLVRLGVQALFLFGRKRR
ncbi:MAG TPA: squalene synthase HpnC [Firmicutes bacterium]|jgi:squalene synthase HpnC|nr:squalene synthase HpnC [Bacillota bacterium]